MSIIVKIIKAEQSAEKNATKRIVENSADIVKEAKTIASLRAKYRGKEFATHMSLAGFSSLAERDQRNNLSAIVWLADEGMELFNAWLADENRANCSTIRGIKKAVTPKQERKPRQPEGEKEEGEGEGETIKTPRNVADIFKNALDQCLAAGISPEEFVEYVASDASLAIFDKAIEKAAA